ncbi:MAG: cytochrome d ubiquinol oxidase subunit II [Alphaproteobacteria bacterium]|jgi:cytochrome d ubiquinol oxidase subunit II|uniref:cytochrome d ubiquinol oxidase subunit II n=1 Tax=Methyloceanibacter sp. TaxID=1965321 RepID=UPI0035615E1E
MTPTAVDMTQVLPVLLPLVWAAILALAVFLYVLLGGYDLGLGVLFPLAPSDRDRDAMMASVAPFWDGNETWLVLGGGGLLAAFPLAYSVMLPALYIPLILMLLGLILRGVAFEFRFKSNRSRWAWDLAFAGGSTLAALMQGGALGAFVEGFAVTDNQFSGGAFDWLTPFSVVTAVATLAGYVLLSAGWLIMKADDALRDWAYGVARYALIAVALFIAIFSLWTPFLHPEIGERWFSPGNIIMFCPVPLLTAFSVFSLWKGIEKRQRYTPFLWGAAIFLLCYVGLAVSLFPFIIPPDITIWQAAAAPDSQLFMLYGAIPLLPIILGYTAYSYYVLWEAPSSDAYH